MPTIRDVIQYSPINNPKPNLDYRYGPWKNEDAYLDTGNIPVKGLTIGISQEDGSIKEMWYVEDPEDSTSLILVEKNPTSEQVQSDWNKSDPSDPAFILHKPTINNVPLSGNKTPSDLGLATAEQGGKADTAIQGVSVNGTEVTPDPTTKKVALIIENGKSAYQLYLDNYEDEHGSTDGALDEAAWLESLQGKSALQIYNETMNTSLDEAGFINVLKQNYPMEYVVYNQTAVGQSIGTAFAAIDQLAASASTAGKLYLMPNDGTTPTGTELFITVQTDATTYMWYRLGALSVPSNVLTEVDIVNDLTTGGADKVPSAAAVKALNEQLYGESVDGTAVASVSQNGCFRKASTGNAWINSGGATSVRIAIPSGAVKVRFSVPSFTPTTRKCQATFTKKQLPSTGKTYQALVDEGYLCDDTTGYNDILKEFAGGSTNTVDVPEGAAFIYFVNKDYDNAYTHPYPASITPITHIDGDVDALIKGNEKAALLEGRVNTLAAAVDVSYRESSMEYTTIPDSLINGGTGDLATSSGGASVAVVNVTGLKKVAFLAAQLSSYTGSSGYVFVDGEENKVDYAKYAINLDAATRGNYECVLDVPEGAVSLKCTVSAANIPLFYVKRIDGDTVTEYVDNSNPLVTMERGTDTEAMTFHKNSNSTDMNVGVLEPTGSVTSTVGAYYTKDIIDVEPNDVITAYVYYVNNGEEVPDTTTKAIQSVCCYKDGTVVTGGYSAFVPSSPNSTRTDKYIVPFGCNGVKVTIEHNSATYPLAKIIVTKANGEAKRYVKVVNNNDYDQRIRIEAMTAGEKYTLPYADVWSNKVIAFSAKVTRDAENGIGTLTIGNTPRNTVIWSTNPASIAINDTTITTRSGNGVSQNGSWSHGLTIDKDIQVIVETDRGEHQLVKITLRSNGQEYVISGNDFIQPYNDTQVRKTWGQVSGARYAQASLGGVFSEVSFANIFKDLLSPVWIFGDSYCSNNGSQRWVHWAEAAGVTNYLLSSFAGATSKDQIKSFRSLIAIRRPKIVAWFLGMNDADSLTSTQSTNPNADWLACLKEVCETCDKYGVIVVLATIPSVKYTNNTIRSNEAKSDWVVASGRRYFDERAAVGDDGTGEWIDGYEEWNTVDGVLTRGDHTSTAGAKALFARLLADVPEIVFND